MQKGLKTNPDLIFDDMKGIGNIFTFISIISSQIMPIECDLKRTDPLPDFCLLANRH